MTEHDSGPDEEERWCAERRRDVAVYLGSQGLVHGRIGDWPAWHVDPIVSIWAVESVIAPGFVGWWAIAGDLPTDYATVGEDRHPRQGLRDICSRWLEVADSLRRGEPHPTTRISGSPASPSTLAALLESRARTLLEWADEESLWDR